ncbi:MAG TPA: cytochrome c peroxidase, partial [Planctomycetota bacterium]|nr:cytochrome c peroxidase [Planctomycetota bacterium]
MRAGLALAALGLGVAAAVLPDEERVTFSDTEVRRLLQHTGLGVPPPDPTNAWADDEGAARLGQRLFFDTRLSANGELACSSCHDPAQGFADGRQLAEGLGTTERHAPSLWNAAFQRWYFWDGRVDTLWGQALQPLENALELGASRTALARLVALDENLRGEYEAVFGALPAALEAATLPEQARPVLEDPRHAHAQAWGALAPERRVAVEEVAVRALKALAAYERRLVSARAPFDVFAEGLRDGDPEKLAALSQSAQRGARLFVGRGRCRTCHSGPNFSDGEFHDIGIAPLGGGRAADSGRFGGLERLLADPFNSASAHSDDREGEKARALASLIVGPQSWGEFKTPSLRNVARTAPYMHQGQFATLEDVLHYYSTLEGMLPAGHHAESILLPLDLDEGERADLLAFLHSLTDEGVDPSLLAPL